MASKPRIKAASNVVEIETDTGSIIVSYETVVAARIPGIGWVTGGYYSVTTSKQVTQTIGYGKYKDHPVVPQLMLDDLLTISPGAIQQIKDHLAERNEQAKQEKEK
jgi:hypothetical protein